MPVILNIVPNKFLQSFSDINRHFTYYLRKKKKENNNFFRVKLKSDLFGLYTLLYVVKSPHIALYKPIFLIWKTENIASEFLLKNLKEMKSVKIPDDSWKY